MEDLMSELYIFWLTYSILLLFGLVVLRVFVRRDYFWRGRLSVPMSLLQALLFFIYGGFPYLYLSDDWPAIHVVAPFHFLGMVFIILGLACHSYGMFRLGVTRSVGHGEQILAHTGIYRRTRNPQALAGGLYVIGFSMLWPSWQALAWAMLYFVLIHIMILSEEQHLLKIHGTMYEEYCQ